MLESLCRQIEFIYGLYSKAHGKVGDSLWIHDLKEGNALFVYYYTCKMLGPLQVLQKSLHKQRSGVILRLSISPTCFFFPLEVVSENHLRGRRPCDISSSSSSSKHGQYKVLNSGKDAQGFVQFDLETLQGWGTHSPSGSTNQYFIIMRVAFSLASVVFTSAHYLSSLCHAPLKSPTLSPQSPPHTRLS